MPDFWQIHKTRYWKSDFTDKLFKAGNRLPKNMSTRIRGQAQNFPFVFPGVYLKIYWK